MNHDNPLAAMRITTIYGFTTTVYEANQLYNRMSQKLRVPESQTKCRALVGMAHQEGSSCYMDSVIFALLALPNEHIEEKLLLSGKRPFPMSRNNNFCIGHCEKREMYGTPQEGYSESICECPITSGYFGRTWEECHDTECPTFCKNEDDRLTNRVRETVREYLKRYQQSIRSETPAPQCGEWKENVRTCDAPGFQKIDDDPVEFLLWLMGLFGLDDSVLKRSLTDASESESIQNIIDKDEDKLSSHYLIVAPGNKPVEVNESVTLGGESKLYLQSIVLHSGGEVGAHYVCFFKCSGRWYVYSDMSEAETRIDVLGNGSFQDMLKAATNGILYFYTEQNGWWEREHFKNVLVDRERAKLTETLAQVTEEQRIADEKKREV